MWFIPVLEVVCVTFRNANIKTECSLTGNVLARNVGARVCIVTDRSSVHVCLHAFICHVGTRGKPPSDILECMFSARFCG